VETLEFLNRVIENTAASLSVEDARKYTNDAQNVILGPEHPMMRVQPDPYFTTTKDIFSYVASLACKNADTLEPGAVVGDIRSIARIYSLSPRCGVFPLVMAGWSPRPQRIGVGRGEVWLDARFALVKSKKPVAQDCLIKWDKSNNPGDTTKTWFAEAYLWPRQIISTNIPLTVPDNYQTGILLETVLAMVEKRSYGRAGYSREEYLYDISQFQSEYANDATQEDRNFTPFRDVP